MAENEEVQLKITLAGGNEAAAQLTRLKQAFGGGGSAEAGGRTISLAPHDYARISQQTRELTVNWHNISRSATTLASRMTGASETFIAGAARLTAWGLILTETYNQLVRYSNALHELQNLSVRTGFGIGVLQNIGRQLREQGILNWQESIAKLSESTADLSRPNSPLRDQLIVMAGAQGGVMAGFIQQYLGLANNQEAQINLVAEVAERIYKNYEEKYGSQAAAVVAGGFGARFGFPDIRSLRRRLQATSEAEKKMYEGRSRDAAAFYEQVGKLYSGLGRVVEFVKSDLIQHLMLPFRVAAWIIDKMVGTLEKTEKLLRALDAHTPPWLKTALGYGSNVAQILIRRMIGLPSFGLLDKHDDQQEQKQIAPRGDTSQMLRELGRRRSMQPQQFSGSSAAEGAASVGILFGRTNWDKFEREARPSTNIEYAPSYRGGGGDTAGTARGERTTLIDQIKQLDTGLTGLFGIGLGGAAIRLPGGAFGFGGGAGGGMGGYGGGGAGGRGSGSSYAGGGAGGGTGGGGGSKGTGGGGPPASAPSGGGPVTGSMGERIGTAKQAMMDQLRKEGVPEANLEEAANLMTGQALSEGSQLDPKLSHDQGTGTGIYGARHERRDRMFKWMEENGYARDSLEGQAKYMVHEAMTDKTYAKTRDVLMSADPKNRAGNTHAITSNFERPRVINDRSGNVARAAGVKPGQKDQPQQPQQPAQPNQPAPKVSGDSPVMYGFKGKGGLFDQKAFEAAAAAKGYRAVVVDAVDPEEAAKQAKGMIKPGEKFAVYGFSLGAQSANKLLADPDLKSRAQEVTVIAPHHDANLENLKGTKLNLYPDDSSRHGTRGNEKPQGEGRDLSGTSHMKTQAAANATQQPQQPTTAQTTPTPTATASPGPTSSTGDARLTTVGNYREGGDPRRVAILDAAKEASKNLPPGWRVEAFSGQREGGGPAHRSQSAIDFRLIDPQGRNIPDYQDPKSFAVYERFAQDSHLALQKVNPQLAQQHRWGGYFSGSLGKGGTYGAMDLMHQDAGGGDARMAAGKWETGLDPQWRRNWNVTDSSQGLKVRQAEVNANKTANDTQHPVTREERKTMDRDPPAPKPVATVAVKVNGPKGTQAKMEKDGNLFSKSTLEKNTTAPPVHKSPVFKDVSGVH